MGKSTRHFDRWNTVMKSTWTYQVFHKYNDELNEMLWANKAAMKQTYSNFKTNGANWTDLASDHLIFDVPKGQEAFKDLKNWSDTYNSFSNWTNLNALLALSSNFETYLATVITLAIESDPGILFDSPNSIDGIVLLKNGAQKNMFHDSVIESITKGDWNARTSAYKKTFGMVPSGLESRVGDLDKIRNLRNKIGHAFGRDIEESRNHEVKETLAMESLSDEQFKKKQYTIMNAVRAIDQHLLDKHIGEYQTIAFYHRIYDGLRNDIHQSERAVILKKQLGQFGDLSGKEFCKELVSYYEKI
ncbi:hypothetical protein [Echinicola sp. 20G]|uniref:hypothetical protein n=1 Tax=Echinicola sp. 20G TaxID=2781961 RepID=UPI0019101EF5|nr:hypothetical protein [Echinicola sp. 20G]